MSHLWAKLSLDIAADKTLNASAKVVYALLVYHCNGKASCYPGIRTLMKECGLSDKTVQAGIAELEKRGYIRVEREKKAGKNARNIYYLHAESAEKNTTVSKNHAMPKAPEKLRPAVAKTTAQAPEKLLHKETEQRKRVGAHSLSDNHKRKRAKASSGRFVKPTVEQVRTYAEQIGFARLSDDPQYFLDKNDSIGWVVGRNNTPMRDWRAAMRIWQKNESPGRAGRDKPEEDRFVPSLPEGPTELEKLLYHTPRIIE